MLNGLFLLQYSLLNGYLLHRGFLRDQKSDVFEIILVSLLLSLCANSLVLYILARLFEMPITRSSVTLMSLTIALIIMSVSTLSFRPKRSAAK